MAEFIHADIFFFVATVSVAVVAVFMVIALSYALGILSRVRRMVERAHREGDLLMDEVAELRRRLHARRSPIAAVYTFVRRLIGRYA